MKLIITGDLHLDAVTTGMPRHAEVREAFGQVIHRAREWRADTVLFLGDLCNPDRGSRTLRAVAAGIEMFRTLVQQAGCGAILIAGNHDVVHDGTGLTSLSPIRVAHGGREPELGDPGVVGDQPPVSGVRPPVPAYVVTPGVVAVAEVPMLLELQGDGHPVQVLALPYTASARPYDPEAVGREVATYRYKAGEALTPLVVAGHLTIEGATLGSETTDMARGRALEFPRYAAEYATLMVNGHYHKRQTVHGIECPGSLARLAFGEEHNEPRWLEVEL